MIKKHWCGCTTEDVNGKIRFNVICSGHRIANVHIALQHFGENLILGEDK